MIQIKFKYYFPIGEDGEYETEIRTLDQIEEERYETATNYEHRVQFVDRLDKNKRELFVGDIIKFNEYNEHGNTGKRIGEIYWDSSECCFAIYSEHSEIGLGTKKGVWLAWAKNIELLGNKFEHPDLQEEY